MPIEISCPHCESTLRIKSRDSEGRVVPCRHCGERFRIEIPVDSDDAFYDDEWSDEADDEVYEAPRRRKSSSRRKKRASNNVPLIAGMSVAGVLLVGILVAVLMRPGDGNPDLPADAEPGDVAERDRQDSVAPQTGAVSDAETEDLGRRFVAAVSELDDDLAAQMFDPDEIANRIVTGLDFPEQELTVFKIGLKAALKQPTGSVGSIVNAIRQGGRAKLIRVREVDGDEEGLAHSNGVNPLDEA